MDHAARARTLFDRDNFGSAIDHALLAMRDADAATQRDLRALVGACLQHRRMSVQALYQLDQVLAEPPDHARALAHRGAARQQLSQQKLAQPDLRRATELDPDYPFAWQWLAYASYDLGDNDTLDEAMANLERLGKPQGYLYQLRGKRRLDDGDRASAEADLRRGCVEGDPMSARHLEDAGFALESGAELCAYGLERENSQVNAEAVKLYREAIAAGFQREGRDEKVTGRLADVLVSLGYTDDARAEVVALTERKPQSGAAWLARARIDGEASSFEKAYALSPADAALPWARHLMGAGRLDDALDVCGKRLAEDPDDAGAHLLLGEIHLAAGRRDEAKQACLDAEALGEMRALRLRVDAFGLERGLDHFELACDLVDRRQRADAVAHFENAIDLFRAETLVPGDGAHRNLAKALYNSALLRELEVADELIEPNMREAVALDPSYTDAMLGLGNLCLRTDRVDEGLEWFARAGALDPSAGQGWFYRARHHAEHGEQEQAVEDATRAFEAYARRGQASFAADAVMLRGRCNEDLGRLQDALRDYDLANEYGHPTGYAMGDKIRARIAEEDPSSPEARKVMDQIIDRIHDNEYPWGLHDALEARVAGNEKAAALVVRLEEEEELDDGEIAWLVEFLES